MTTNLSNYSQYAQTTDELYTLTQRNINESKSTFLLYNGALDVDEDPADYMASIKAVRLA